MGQTIQVSLGHQEGRYIVRLSQPNLGVLSVKFPRDKYIITYYSEGLDINVLKLYNKGLEFNRHNHHTKGIIGDVEVKLHAFYFICRYKRPVSLSPNFTYQQSPFSSLLISFKARRSPDPPRIS
jgi:hypothetical protein